MTVRKLIIATALLASTAGFAVAQNTMSPSNPARPGMQGDDSSKPNGLQNNAGTGLPAKAGTSDSSGAMKSHSAPTTGTGNVGGHATTGPGTNPAHETSDKNASPASPNAGVKQEK